ncbi:hypothetical protein BDA99DRAFT_565795 [Phascolomyces articulosus]|uniref:C2H2-type domain-containing protein n=1 Tax=Phascolomyces articulosus TaxID=60185 RepID=A0AAD5P823_9FUNG|nr:hypothetical protein BDA99DRAFT_565795 [Phascolomyces articulosus]
MDPYTFISNDSELDINETQPSPPQSQQHERPQRCENSEHNQSGSEFRGLLESSLFFPIMSDNNIQYEDDSIPQNNTFTQQLAAPSQHNEPPTSTTTTTTFLNNGGIFYQDFPINNNVCALNDPTTTNGTSALILPEQQELTGCDDQDNTAAFTTEETVNEVMDINMFIDFLDNLSSSSSLFGVQSQTMNRRHSDENESNDDSKGSTIIPTVAPNFDIETKSNAATTDGSCFGLDMMSPSTDNEENGGISSSNCTTPSLIEDLKSSYNTDDGHNNFNIIRITETEQSDLFDLQSSMELFSRPVSIHNTNTYASFSSNYPHHHQQEDEISQANSDTSSITNNCTGSRSSSPVPSNNQVSSLSVRRSRIGILPGRRKKYRCFFGTCSSESQRKRDLVWRHMVPNHFHFQIKFKCFMHEKDEERDMERTATRRDTVLKHVKMCWKKYFKRIPGNESKPVPSEPPKDMYHIYEDDSYCFHCEFPGCTFKTDSKKDFGNHLFDIHDDKNR